MRFSLASVAGLAAMASGLNILITNDDGFAASNMRAMYNSIKALGHNAWVVASVNDQSGMGGRAVFSNLVNLTADSEFGIVKAGSPALGRDPNDSHVFYYNGTPATMIFMALDYVLPKYANFSTPDLVLAGPNFGLNLGPFLYTLSGTIAATYAAVERNIPAIAFSAAYGVQTSYTWINASTAAGLQDPAVITGQLAANLAQAFIDKAKGGRILPPGYGISVNMPYITSFTNASCVNPPYILTRMTTGATTDSAVYNNVTGLFSYGSNTNPAITACINGDCSLPGETTILGSGCQSSVTFFTTDYDAPYGGQCSNTTNPYSLIPSMVYLNNATNKVGPLGSSFNPSATASASKAASATGAATTGMATGMTTATTGAGSPTTAASGTAASTTASRLPSNAASPRQLPGGVGLMGFVAALLV